MIKIHKLRYDNKQQAIADLLAKNVYTRLEDQLTYGEGVHCVAELGPIVLENAEMDDEGNIIKPSFVDEGYHVDVMIEREIEFENEVRVNNPKHSFLGW
jgi:hypothetical protein